MIDNYVSMQEIIKMSTMQKHESSQLFKLRPQELSTSELKNDKMAKSDTFSSEEASTSY